jgi:RNA polymerase sigma factor (sigma-70 family)
MTVVPIDDGSLRDERADDAFNDALTRALAASLPATQRTILMRHASDGITLTTIARELGISRRTVTRHWRTVRHQLVKEIAA